jgi:putative transposon-encoded protein
MAVKKEAKNEKSSDKSKSNNEILIKLAGSEILERQVSAFGTGCHVIVPKEYVGKKVKIIFEGDD